MTFTNEDYQGALARTSDPQTSHEAAGTVNITYLEGKVLDAIKAARQGATQDELVEATGLPSNTVTPRFKPLLKKGVVYAGGTRKGSSGKAQRVLFAKPGVTVKAASSPSAIVRAVEAERALSKAQAQIAEAVKTAREALLTAESLADQNNVEFTFDMFDMRGRFVPGDGWYAAHYGAV